jgi:YD repeat-containing protein
MSRLPRSYSSAQINSLCLLLIYTLAISLFSPFAIKRVEAATADKPVDQSAIKKAVPPPATKAQEQKSRWREGEILVRFRDNAPAQKLNDLLRANGAQWNGQLRGGSGIERLGLKAGSDPEAVAALLRSNELVDFAEPNYLINADLTSTMETSPNDPRFSEQWALKNGSASQVWETTTGSKQTVIAVIDSGIDFSHPDLINNQWDNSLERANKRDDDGNDFNDDFHGWDFISNSGEITDGQGHGTAIGGIIAAEGNNAIGITGVMWRASLMSLRVLDSSGTGDIASAIEAIDYATANGAQVINCSWGTDESSLALREAINRAAQRGVVVVASAGNNSRDIETTLRYPASYDLPNLISVASTDNSDSLTSFSNWGATHVSIAAPGADLLTTKMGGDYQTVSGTSASTALVTGVGGLIKNLRPWLNADRTREMILRGAKQIPSLSDKVASKGIVSADGALSSLSTLSPYEGLDESVGNNGGGHGRGRGDKGNNPDDRRNDRPDTKNPDRNSDGRDFTVTPLAPVRGVPGTGLPNLEDLRRKQPSNPKAPDAVPSTRCSHHDPECNKEKETDRKKTKAAIDSPNDSPIGFLAWGLNLPATEAPFGGDSRPVSDSPFQLFRSSPVNNSASILRSLLPPSPPPSNNLASGKAATQSSDYPAAGLTASQAVNGQTSDLTHTQYEAQAWWQVDLGSVNFIDSVKLWNRVDCCQDRLSNFYIFVSDVPFTSTNLTTTLSQAGVSSYYTTGAAAATLTKSVNRSGRYVRVQLTGTNYLSLAEVEVFGSANIAASGAASQSSDYPAPGATAAAAVNGNFSDTTATQYEAQPWWQVDLGSVRSLGTIKLWNRADCCPERLSNFYVFVSDSPFQSNSLTQTQNQAGVASYYMAGQAGAPSIISMTPNQTGRYVRIQLVGSNYLSLTEVQVWGGSARINVAASANGGAASASSTLNANYPASGAINGEHKGLNYGSGGVWHGGAATFPQWLQVDFNGNKTIDEIDVYTIQNDYANPSEPTETTTFTTYGLTAYEVQYWNGTGWITVPGGSVSGNNRAWRKFAFSPITTGKIRVLTNASVDGWSRIAEVEAYGSEPSITVDYMTPLVDPNNRTGSGGVDLLSGNANWSLPILGLKGRAGLDLGLSLSYNSLVWTKSQDGSSIKFDVDRGTPSPGFRLGFPVIQAPYYNQQTGKNSYQLITPSGGHVDLRQVGTSNVYDAGDSSFLQLIDNGGSLTLRPTDGSQLSFELKNGQYYCVQIKDRNGNYITITNHDDGRINTITDTLGRVVTFVYDSFKNLKEITQQWMANSQLITHKWATFGWSNQTINPNFSGLNVIGPQNSTSIPMLTSVGLGDGTYYKFRYTSWGQVDKVTSYAADSQVNGQMLDTHTLNYTLYTLAPSSSANDCPRVTDSRVKAENWNNDAEATTTYLIASDHSSGQATMPDGTIYKELFDTTANWQRGLTTGTEYWSASVKKKWTTVAYTQTNTGINYRQNPRVTETNVYDAEGNRKRSTIDYGAPGGSYEQWNLPYLVREYAADGVTEIRHNFTDYNLSQTYLDRRIIGLVSGRNMSNAQTWQSIVLYSYDAGGAQLVATENATIQHDAAYGTASQWRGNLTTVTRYDVDNINDPNKRAVTQVGYDTNGSVVFSQDPLAHKTVVKYDDSFSDTTKNSLNTYAYPTKVTPPLALTGESEASFSSTSQYDYYIGAVTRTQGAVPAGQTQGLVQTFEYDSAARISRINNLVNNAYQRWVYDPAGHVSTYTLLQTGGQEAFSSTIFDGMGRVRGTSADYPNSVGLYRGQLTQYDVMGRVFKQSNPAELNSSWAPVGDDAAGLVYTQQAYDWKGRPTVTTNPDGTTKQATYGGCGCAGGEVVTVRDEVGRQQRVTSDILGRAWKTEVLEQYPSQTVHSTTTNTFNARDQITSVYQVGSSGPGQTTTLTYDGHGRLKTQQTPAQIASSAVTTYAYNNDDTVKNVTDGRGAVTDFTYNYRRQTTLIGYTAPSGITDPTDITFTYDAAGNRTSMTDGSGSVSYVYDQLSRLTSESRTFAGPLSGNTYTLSYSYNLAGGLTSVTDPTGASISYAYDKSGRTTAVTGSTFGGVTEYASNLQYRAWGDVKNLSTGDGKTTEVYFNSRLQATDFSVGTSNSGVISKHYDYNADGRLRYSQDQLDNRFDRSYTYDHMGRVTEAFSGPMARGLADTTNRPYKQYYQYDALDHLTGRVGSRLWAGLSGGAFGTHTYVNDRNTAWQYDNDGRLTSDTDSQYTFDAAGRPIGVITDNSDQTYTYDGDGVKTKIVSTDTSTSEVTTIYQVTSSVLDQVVTQLDQTGQKTRGFVYSNGQMLAWQQKSGSTESVLWKHSDPGSASYRMTNNTGQTDTTESRELDHLGSDAGTSNPFVFPRWHPVGEDLTAPGFADMMSGRCRIDGMDAPCSMTYRMLSSGGGSYAPSSTLRHKDSGWETWTPSGGWEAFGPQYISPLSTPGINQFADPAFRSRYANTAFARSTSGITFSSTPNQFAGTIAGLTTNPNCFLKAIAGSPGIGRGMVFNPDTGSPDDIATHDGWHTLSTKEGGMARTLAPLTGTVIDVVKQSATDPKTLWNVYVRADGQISGQGFYIAYKDFPSLESIVVRRGQHLGVNSPIGTVRPAGDPRNYFGLHITLVRAQYWSNFRNDKITLASQGRQMESNIRRAWIIDPNSKESPINCLK